MRARDYAVQAVLQGKLDVRGGRARHEARSLGLTGHVAGGQVASQLSNEFVILFRIERWRCTPVVRNERGLDALAIRLPRISREDVCVKRGLAIAENLIVDPERISAGEECITDSPQVVGEPRTLCGGHVIDAWDYGIGEKQAVPGQGLYIADDRPAGTHPCDEVRIRSSPCHLDSLVDEGGQVVHSRGSSAPTLPGHLPGQSGTLQPPSLAVPCRSLPRVLAVTQSNQPPKIRNCEGMQRGAILERDRRLAH